MSVTELARLDALQSEIRSVLCANMFDGCDAGMLTMKTSALLDEASELIAEHLRDRLAAVTADAARIEWMQDHMVRYHAGFEAHGTLNADALETHLIEHEGNLRAAIDAAIAARAASEGNEGKGANGG